jgi:hypothetical protein
VTGAPLRVFAVILAWAAAACGPGFLLRAPDAPKDCGRIAAGPAVVSVFEFDPSGGLKPRSDWTYDAGQNVDAAIAARVKHAGGRTFVAADVAHTDVTSDDFRHWASKTLQEIAAAIAKNQPPAHQSVADWRFPESLTTWRAALGSDFALVLLFVDAYEPVATGPSSSASSRYDPAQTGVACLVSFKDSRVVACGTSPRRFGDLRTGESARDAVDDLVARICA